ncbi:MAG: class I SAM-dependent methyltransferase [Bacteroidota bacterium]|nr:class I SAM-dependent methyltransferase [Bacteroidota bacterium]MDP4211046.1 class I SAM-dependent methyltransferase [Bacteroidota bacterium]MDP4248732.1 class I SAM-dependent methyltransferase [Bacteroidota bacterium]
MPLFGRFKQSFFLQRSKGAASSEAYDQWSATYDSQPDNLMLALDEQLTAELLKGISLQSKIIADIGCGTGRHWEKIRKGNPGRIFGFDVSAGMLAILKQKYPQAETFLLRDNHLPGLENDSCDLLLSTLTIAHIRNPAQSMKEWCRVLKPGARMLITDYHPAALAKGARRTFSHNHQTIAIRNYIHSIEKLNKIARQLGLKQVRFIERKIDETVKSYYDKQQAIALYEDFYGTPIIYGLLLIKSDAGSPC